MLYVIGLGLGDAKDVTVKGLEIIKKCDRVYLESYTSILTDGPEALEKFYGRPIIVADREFVEGAEEILSHAEKEDVGFLVVGDPFGATTHTDLVLRARNNNIKVQVVHNASILNAVSCCGLQLYTFGQTVSIPFWTESWKPTSFYEKIAQNRENGLHTLCLLDIKVKEPTLESLCSKRKEFLPPRFMTVSDASNQLMQIVEQKLANKEEVAFDEKSLVVGLARVGTASQEILACSLEDMSKRSMGEPLHSLVIPAKHLHPLEHEYLIQYALNVDEFPEQR